MLQEQHYHVKNNIMPKKISNIDTQKELPYGSSLQVYGVYGFERMLGNVGVAISRSSS